MAKSDLSKISGEFLGKIPVIKNILPLQAATTINKPSAAFDIGKIVVNNSTSGSVYLGDKKIENEHFAPAGNQELLVKNLDGLVLKRDQVVVKSNGSINYSVVDVNPWKTVSLSLIPGLGQIMTDRPVMGYIYAGSFAVALGAVVFSQIDFSESTKAWEDAVGEDDKKRTRDNYNEAMLFSNVSLAGLVAVYGINLADAYFLSPKVETRIAGLPVSCRPDFAVDLSGKTSFSMKFDF